MQLLEIKSNGSIDTGLRYINIEKIVKVGYYKHYSPDPYWAVLDSGEFIYFNEATYLTLLDVYSIAVSE